MAASNSIESIKRQMQNMKTSKEDALDRTEKAEQKVFILLEKQTKQYEERDETLKRIAQLQAIVVATNSDLEDAHQKLESATKFAAHAEKEVFNLQKKISDIEEQMDHTELKLKNKIEQLNVTSVTGEDSERTRKTLEARFNSDLARILELEKKLAEAIKVAEVSDKRFEDVSEKILAMEVDLDRAEDRAETAEVKLKELEEECRVLSNVMKSLEASEQEAKQREENFAELMREYTEELKDTEERADLAERTMVKLQKEVDRLEEELMHEKEKFKAISGELENTMNEVAEY